MHEKSLFGDCVDGRALIDAGSERREREMKLGFLFYFGWSGDWIGETGWVCVCVREERERRDIYIRW